LYDSLNVRFAVQVHRRSTCSSSVDEGSSFGYTLYGSRSDKHAKKRRLEPFALPLSNLALAFISYPPHVLFYSGCVKNHT